MILNAWVNYTDPEGQTTWVNGCLIQFASRNTSIVNVNPSSGITGDAVIIDGVTYQSDGHTYTKVSAYNTLGTTNVNITYYLPSGTLLGRKSPAYTVFDVAIKAEDGEADPPGFIPVGKITKFFAKVLPDELAEKDNEFMWEITTGKNFAQIAGVSDDGKTVSIQGIALSVKGKKEPKPDPVKLKLTFKPSGSTRSFNDEHEFLVGKVAYFWATP